MEGLGVVREVVDVLATRRTTGEVEKYGRLVGR